MMAAAVLAASCAKELIEEPVLNDEAKVTFSVNTPEIATRAYSDGMTATVLQYAVYDEAGTELELGSVITVYFRTSGISD